MTSLKVIGAFIALVLIGLTLFEFSKTTVITKQVWIAVDDESGGHSILQSEAWKLGPDKIEP